MATVPDPTSDAEAKAAVFRDVMQERLGQQFENNANADGKIATILSIASLQLPVFGALLVAEVQHLGIASIALGILGGIYITILVILFLAYRKDALSARPDPDELRKRVEDSQYDSADIIFWIAISIAESLKDNEARIREKARQTTVALVLVVLEFVILTLAVLAAT